LPLIRKVASTGKPLIISTGLASLMELDEAVGAARSAGCKNLILLKCTSTYPASPLDTNVRTIPHLASLFNCCVGLSDHTAGIGVAVAATALGACVIEKHFCLSREEGGVDSAFSLEPNELKMLVEETERAWQSLGVVYYGPTPAEIPSLNFRRSLYVCSDLACGDRIMPENVRIVRPGRGLHPRFYEIVLGRKVNQDIPRGTALSFDFLT